MIDITWQQWKTFLNTILADDSVWTLAEQYDCLIGGLELTQDIRMLDNDAIDTHGRCALELIDNGHCSCLGKC